MFGNLIQLDDLVGCLSKELPFDFCIENDKCGIQINTKRKISKVLVTYEITDEVVDEALETNSNCIVSFHPLIFYPLEKIDFDDRVGRLISKLIQNNIALIITHTNFDSHPNGTSRLFANQLGLEFVELLEPRPNDQNYGMGVIGRFSQPLEVETFLQKVYKITCSPIRWCEGRSSSVQTVAIVGGSGMSFASAAFRKGVDAFLTGDVSYHNFHRYKNKMIIVDAGHWETEMFVAKGLYELVCSATKDFDLEIVLSNINTNPVRYYISGNK